LEIGHKQFVHSVCAACPKDLNGSTNQEID
jgi:hypothetical protein